MLIGSIGIISALLQGGYVRRVTSKIGEGVMARRGVSSCAGGLALLALLPQFVSTQPTLALRLLQGAAVCMAFTSATVVNSLTAFASLQCDESAVDPITGKPKEHSQLAKGKALGQFRSSGQLGRALGPLLGMFRSVCLFLLLTCTSMRIILDFWSIFDIRYLRGRYDRLVHWHELNSSDKVLIGTNGCNKERTRIFNLCY